MIPIKVFMVGEAAGHRDELLAQMKSPLEAVPLPASAAFGAEYDGQIGPDDVVITLNYRREGGEKGPAFKMLHVPGAGLDGIDRASLADGCVLCNVFEHQIPIAEYVMLVMLEWEIRLSEMRKSFTPENWPSIYASRIFHGELYSKTLGLIGFGGIGRAIASRAKAFGMTVLAVDKYPRDDEGLADELTGNDRIDEVLERADFVVVSCPLTDETTGWIDARRIARMKKDAFLINISRGPILSQKDIYEALAEKRIGGAALDVWWRYPKPGAEKVEPADYPFHLLENVYCTPHSCAWTKELTWRRYGVIAKNIEALRDGKPLVNVIAPK